MKELNTEEQDLLVMALYEWCRNIDPGEIEKGNTNNNESIVGSLLDKLGLTEEEPHITGDFGTDL